MSAQTGAKPSGLAGGMKEEGCPEVRGVWFQAPHWGIFSLPVLISWALEAAPLHPLRRRALGKLIRLENIEKGGWKVDSNSDRLLPVS